MSLSKTQKGIFFAFLGYSCFTLNDACVKWLGMVRGYDVTTIMFWIYLIVLAICLVLALPLGIKKTLRTRTPVVHLTRSLFMACVSWCAASAFSIGMPLATLYIIIFLSPALTAIGAIPIYKEHVSKKSWMIIFLGFAGIIVAFHNDISIFTSGARYALGVLFMGTAINLLSRRIDQRDHPLSLPFYPALVILPILFVHMKGHIPFPEIADVPVFLGGGALLLMAIMGVIQGFRIGAFAKVSPTQYSQMLSGLIVGYYVFHDMPTMWVLIGAGMIIASGLLLVTQRK